MEESSFTVTHSMRYVYTHVHVVACNGNARRIPQPSERGFCARLLKPTGYSGDERTIDERLSNTEGVVLYAPQTKLRDTVFVFLCL